MKRYTPLAFLLAAALYISITAFQCGSAEMTSAKLYRDQKQYDKAEASCLKELAKNDKNEEAWYILGQVRYEVKKYAGMNEAFTKALQVSDVHKADVNKYRVAAWASSVNDGVTWFNKGRDSSQYFPQALESFKTAIGIEPDSGKTYQLLGMTYYAMNDLDNAVANYEIALKKRPDLFEVANSLGRIHYMRAAQREAAGDKAGGQQEYSAAARAFEISYNAAPDSIEHILNLLDAYDRSGEPDKALHLTEVAIQHDRNNKLFHYAYGVFLLKRAEADAKAERFASADSGYGASVVQFQNAVDLDPEYTDAIYNLGVANLNWGVMLKSVEDKKAEGAGKGTKGRDSAAETRYKEKFKTALPYLVKSSTLRANDAGLWTTLGRIYAILNMPDKSKEAFQKADALTKAK